MDIYLINSLYLLNNYLLWIYNNNDNYICFNPNVFRQKIKLSLKMFNLIMYSLKRLKRIINLNK